MKHAEFQTEKLHVLENQRAHLLETACSQHYFVSDPFATGGNSCSPSLTADLTEAPRNK